jgi:hypothetical protein
MPTPFEEAVRVVATEAGALARENAKLRGELNMRIPKRHPGPYRVLRAPWPDSQQAVFIVAGPAGSWNFPDDDTAQLIAAALNWKAANSS